MRKTLVPPAGSKEAEKPGEGVSPLTTTTVQLQSDWQEKLGDSSEAVGMGIRFIPITYKYHLTCTFDLK